MKTLLILVATLTVVTGTVRAETTFAENHAATLLPEDREVLAGAEKGLRADLTKWEKSPGSQAAVAEIQKLLDLPRQRISSPAELEGDWRVRSLQVSQFGAIAYPFFSCRIFPEAEALVFQKAKGSQRRHGLLGCSGDSKFLFLGGSYYEGDPVPSYSARRDHPTAADRERDSVGFLYKVGKDRAVMLFAPVGGRWEIYELVR